MVGTRMYMGVDYGMRKVGVALADAETCIAHAHAVFARGNAPERIATLCTSHGVQAIIVGVPVNVKYGNDGSAVHAFIAQLRDAVPHAEIHTVDEMFTTRIARTHRIAAGKRGGDDDAEAARVLLQEWCDSHNV